MYVNYKFRKASIFMKKNDSNKSENSFSSSSINWYPGHMAKTKREIQENIKIIDIVYEVLDARTPYSSKINDFDEIIKNKPRVIIMAKKDLCDLDITKKWINYYEKQNHKVLLMDLHNNKDYKELVNITKEILKEKQEKRLLSGLKKKEIKAVVMGIPNVGKSTLINQMVGKKVAKVGNIPGITTHLNWLKTKTNILILDTPGILMPKLTDNNVALNLASTGAIKSEVLDVNDIGSYLVCFYKNYYPQILKEVYKVEIQDDVIDIMASIALKMGFIKNNDFDPEKVSKCLYNDVINGKIKGVTFDPWIY